MKIKTTAPDHLTNMTSTKAEQDISTIEDVAQAYLHHRIMQPRGMKDTLGLLQQDSQDQGHRWKEVSREASTTDQQDKEKAEVNVVAEEEAVHE